MLKSYDALPGPPPVRNVFGLWRLVNRLNEDVLGFVSEQIAQHGPVFRMDIMNLHQVLVTDPVAIRDVLVTKSGDYLKDADYSDKRRGLARFVGEGLLTSEGALWKRQRKLVAPAFHTRRITEYAETMVQYAQDTADGWRDGQPTDVARDMTSLTLRIVARTLFNTDLNEQTLRVASAMDVIQHVSGDRSILPTWVPTPIELKARRASADLDRVVYEVIADWRAQGVDRGDLLSMLMLARDEDNQPMPDRLIRDETVTLFLAGHETTANALNWTWYLLAQHPHIAQRMHAELDEVLGDRPPTLADLDRLPYNERVVKEAMRIYPPAWGYSRVAVRDTSAGDYAIPKGTVVMISAYHAHRNPAHWADPLVFDPERFAPERETERYAYVPFGAGPRVCVGQAFAMMEARLLLATLAQRVHFDLAEGASVQFMPRITLYPANGLPMVVRERQPAPVVLA